MPTKLLALSVFLFPLFLTPELFAEEAKMPVAATSHPDIKEFFNKFNKDNLNLADEFYHPDVEFQDPIVTLRGREKLKAYYANMYKNVISIHFDFSDVVTEGDRQVGVWTMYLKAKGLNGGQEIAVRGTSHVVYKDGKAIYHRDYFDMGEFIYEHIPVLSSIIEFVKSKLH